MFALIKIYKLFVLVDNRPLNQILFKPPKDVTAPSFEQACINAGNGLAKIHDICKNDMARECAISLKHLRVC